MEPGEAQVDHTSFSFFFDKYVNFYFLEFEFIVWFSVIKSDVEECIRCLIVSVKVSEERLKMLRLL